MFSCKHWLLTRAVVAAAWEKMRRPKGWSSDVLPKRNGFVHRVRSSLLYPFASKQPIVRVISNVLSGSEPPPNMHNGIPSPARVLPLY
jgi:hypothetical protein